MYVRHLPGENLGRKKTFIIGVVIMSIGAIIQTCAFSVPQMIVARLITGVFIDHFSIDYQCDLNLNSTPGLGNGLVPPYFYFYLIVNHTLLYLKYQHGDCASMAK